MAAFSATKRSPAETLITADQSKQIPALSKAIAETDRKLHSSLSNLKGTAHLRLFRYYGTWNAFAKSAEARLAKKDPAALGDAARIILVGNSLITISDRFSAHFQKTILGHPENKTTCMREAQESGAVLNAASEAMNSAIAWVRDSSKASLDRSDAAIKRFLDKADSLPYYQKAFEYQDRIQKVIQYYTAVNRQIDDYIKLANSVTDRNPKTFSRTDWLPPEESDKILRQFDLLKYQANPVLIRSLSIRLHGGIVDGKPVSGYMLSDALRRASRASSPEGFILENEPKHWLDIEGRERALPRISGVAAATAWQPLLAAALKQYHEKGYAFGEPKDKAKIKERQMLQERIRKIITAAKSLLDQEIQEIPKIRAINPQNEKDQRLIAGLEWPARMKARVKEQLELMDKGIISSSYADLKKAFREMSKRNLEADKDIAQRIASTMERYFGNTTWWERNSRVAGDFAVAGLGLITIIATGGTGLPLVLAAESLYWGSVSGMDFYAQYAATKKLPTFLQALGALAAVAAPGAAAVRFGSAFKIGELGAELRPMLAIRAPPELVKSRLAAMSLEAAGATSTGRVLGRVQKYSGQFLLGSALYSAIDDPKSILHIIPFLFIGAAHGVIAPKMLARTIKRYPIEVGEAILQMKKPMSLAVVPESAQALDRAIPKVGKVPKITAVMKKRRAAAEEKPVEKPAEVQPLQVAEATNNLMAVLRVEQVSLHAAVGAEGAFVTRPLTPGAKPLTTLVTGVASPAAKARKAAMKGASIEAKIISESKSELTPFEKYEQNKATLSEERKALRNIGAEYEELYFEEGKKAVQEKFGLDIFSESGKATLNKMRITGDYKRLNEIYAEYTRGARTAINNKFNIRPEEFVVTERAYDVIVNGNLRQQVQSLIGTKIEGPIYIRLMSGLSGVQHLLRFSTIDGRELTVFMKPMSGKPDVLMMNSLRSGGASVPEYKIYSFKNPYGRLCEYGLSLDVRHMPEINSAVSYKAMERTELIYTKSLVETLDNDLNSPIPQTSRSLGYLSQLEITLGMQDNNINNKFFALSNGKISTVRIDADIGFSYLTEAETALVYAGYMKAKINALNTAMLLHLGRSITKNQVTNFVNGFLEGVSAGHEATKIKSFQSRIHLLISEYDGKIGPGRIPSALEGKTSTNGEVNGRTHSLEINDLNNTGRITMDKSIVTALFNERASWDANKTQTFWIGVFKQVRQAGEGFDVSF